MNGDSIHVFITLLNLSPLFNFSREFAAMVTEIGAIIFVSMNNNFSLKITRKNLLLEVDNFVDNYATFETT